MCLQSFFQSIFKLFSKENHIKPQQNINYKRHKRKKATIIGVRKTFYRGREKYSKLISKLISRIVFVRDRTQSEVSKIIFFYCAKLPQDGAAERMITRGTP